MSKIKTFTALLLFAFLLAGCSSRFAYNNLDWLVHWYLDDYVELEREQKVVFDENFDQWQSWHREQELIQYRNHLGELREQLSHGNLSQQQWLGHFERGRGHWMRLRDRISPELASFALLLSDEQIQSVFAEIADKRAEAIEEYQDVAEEDRLDERIEGMQEDVERWIGDLSDLQKSIIQDYAPRFRPTFATRLAYQQRMQTVARELLAQRGNQPDFQARFVRLLMSPEEYQDQQFKDDAEHNRQLSAHMSAVLNQTLTDKQKQHIDKELGELIEDIDALLPEYLQTQVKRSNNL